MIQFRGQFRLAERFSRSRAFALVAVAVGALVIATPAAAFPLLFTFTGATTGSFGLDSNPTPTFIGIDHIDADITGQTGDFLGENSVSFYDLSADGGLQSFPNNTVDLFGLPIPHGTFAHPVFSPGVTHLVDTTGTLATTLSISAPGARAPELGAGPLAAAMVAAALALTRRRRPPAPA